MRVLLTTSAAPRYSPFDTREKRFPIGIGFLIAMLEQAGHKVHFIDRFLWPRDYFAEDILLMERIDMVGIYSNTVCFADTRWQLEKLQSLREKGVWKGIVVVGGPHASICPDTIPDYVDHVVIGEGENVILDIAEGRANERIIRGEPICDLDSLPFPAYHHFVAKPYKLTVSAFSDVPVFAMNTSRGCPFHCRFCSVKAVWGKTYRAFSAERIVREIEKLIVDYDIRGVYFREDHFTFSRKRTVDFCELLLKRDIRIKWLCESRVHPLPEEIIPLMAKAGCRWIYFGCESGSPRLLKEMRKGITVEHIRDTLSKCKKYDIKAFTTWVIGLPGETEEDRKKTVDLIRETDPFTHVFSMFVGLPGSEYCEQLRNSEEYYATDEVGLVYSKMHNRLANRFRGRQWPGYIYPDGTVGPLPTDGFTWKAQRLYWRVRKWLKHLLGFYINS